MEQGISENKTLELFPLDSTPLERACLRECLYCPEAVECVEFDNLDGLELSLTAVGHGEGFGIRVLVC